VQHAERLRSFRRQQLVDLQFLVFRVLGRCWHPTGPARQLPAETATPRTTTQIYEGTNQIQRMVMARQLLK
jgi:alkylation response protein AidB-like acyl-CoA dehydrogenase